MEIFSELILTISLSLIFAAFFIKLVAMQPINNDNDNDNYKLTEEAQMIDKFQYKPFKEEVIKLEDCSNEGKSSVELYNVVGVNKEECKFQDVEVVGNKEGETEGNDDDDGDDDNDDKNPRFKSEEENGGENKLCEIEIETEEEEEEEEEVGREIGIMDDWEEIGRKDFEELLGNKAGFYNVEVEYEK